MQKQRKVHFARLEHVIQTSRNANTENNNILSLGEPILKIASLSRKLETEREKIETESEYFDSSNATTNHC